jgi:RNA 2',3'-cyclic 3'-phosphodiesterase
MRLFTAIELPDDARTAIAAVQKTIAARLADSPRSLRLVRPEHLHLTLVFIGEVAPESAAAIVDLMSADILEPPFRAAFGGVGVFPPAGPPRTLWLGLVEGGPNAVAVHARVSERLRRAGVEPDRKAYRPHLTLGRWRDRDRQARGKLPSTIDVVATMDVDVVTLFESKLTQAGPSYTRLARARLSCP